MINKGNEKGNDMENLGEKVRERVLENQGIRMKWEIKSIGLLREGEKIEEFIGKIV